MMTRAVKIAGCILLVVLGQSPGSLADGVKKNPPVQSAVDTGDAPRCGHDGICNIAACKKDPDCPADMPQDQTPDPDSPNRPSDIADCTSQESTEMGLAIDWGAAHWTEYEAVLEDIRDWPVNIGSCLEDRFKYSGKVVCEKSMKGGCTRKGEAASGFASPFNRKCHMCPGFLAAISKLRDPVANRQACYFAMATHEWGHTCDRGHKTLEIIDDEAFNFWKSRHPEVTISFHECLMS